MNEVFLAYLEQFTMVYLDHMLVYSETWSEHLQDLRLVLQELRKNNIYCTISKCVLVF